MKRAMLLLAAVVATPRPVVAGGGELVLDGQIGPALMLESRSHALGHMIKPEARLGLRHTWRDRFELGGAAVGLLVASEHYRLLGAVAHARFAVWQRPRFSLGAGAALGMGYDADILHADLAADGAVAPYGFLALDGRWTIAERWLLGVEIGWQNLATAHLGVVVGYRFGPSGQR